MRILVTRLPSSCRTCIFSRELATYTECRALDEKVFPSTGVGTPYGCPLKAFVK